MTQTEFLILLDKQPAHSIADIAAKMATREWPAELGPVPDNLEHEWWIFRQTANQYIRHDDEEDEIDYFARRDAESG